MAQDVTTGSGGAQVLGSAIDPQNLTHADGSSLAGVVFVGTGGGQASGSSVA